MRKVGRRIGKKKKGKVGGMEEKDKNKNGEWGGGGGNERKRGWGEKTSLVQTTNILFTNFTLGGGGKGKFLGEKMVIILQYISLRLHVPMYLCTYVPILDCCVKTLL